MRGQERLVLRTDRKNERPFMANLSALITRFFWVMLFASVVVSVLGVLSLSVLGRLPPPVMIALPPAVAAWDAGRRYMRDSAEPPAEALAWKISGIFLLIFFGTVITLFAGAIAAQGGSFGPLLPFIQPAIFFVFLFFLMIRVMFWLGVRAAS